MAKKLEVKPATTIEIPSIKETGFVNEDTAKEMCDVLVELDDEVEITSEYYVPEVGVKVRAFYLGPKTIRTPDGKEVPAARLLLADGTFSVCASVMLVNNLSGLPPKTPIEFVKKGEGTNAAKQKYDNFSIKLLGRRE